ncbi:MAG: aminopeptidase N [Cellvibrionales bacterium]|nr:aminopeptidase N [Cellvibrionales bacterium]
MRRHSPPQTIRLADYRPPPFFIRQTRLWVDLHASRTRVRARLDLERNPDPAAPAASDLRLDAEDLRLCSVAVDGRTLQARRDYQYAEDGLKIFTVGERLQLETVVEICPQENRSLMGLYRSRQLLCTQCEAEGFRRITPYLDRPDVLSRFTTTLTADRSAYPLLLAGGNMLEAVEQEDGRHSVTWQDPFPKPAYLFALVAGDLACLEDRFTTRSGREVALRIFAEEKDLEKCGHAMRSLQAAMRWDEQTYGREYDLDTFMIVAVDDFNMGAMENKGLNIFNTAALLAHPRTTTDTRFQWVEAVVAHEYFHNWSGNRVTCRDWFQLSLKEGFTVFRDSEFSAAMNCRTVKRVEDVRTLRDRQFAEDAGPLAHPVQPDSYMEINNFYTLTVYEKGAEVVRMQANLLGAEQFRKGTDLYFDRHDGQAATIEDFLACMQEVSGLDLTQFKRWYKQAGTPLVQASGRYDPRARTYTLELAQQCPPTPECAAKKPFLIPIRMGLLGRTGPLPLHCTAAGLSGATEGMLHLNKRTQTFVFTNIDEPPVPSLLRGFSAPVRLHFAYQPQELAHLAHQDSDGFNRWDAMQQLFVREIQAQQQAIEQGTERAISADLVDLLSSLTADASLDPATLALLLALPSIDYLAGPACSAESVALDSLWPARQSTRRQLAAALHAPCKRLYQQNQSPQPYAPEAAQIGQRSLKNTALNYWVQSGDETAIAACEQQFAAADNMTDQLAALSALVNAPDAPQAAEDALAQFHRQWQHEALVVNSWFHIQAAAESPGGLARVPALLQHPDFDRHNPNKAMALLGGFCTLNPHNFHQRDGAGYRLLADQVLDIDRFNPQLAARLLDPLTRWQRMDKGRAGQMRAQLRRMGEASGLSADLQEILIKSQ